MNTSSSNRFGSFFSRVQTEREVLSIVNGTFAEISELPGLTMAAIQAWKERVSLDWNEEADLERIYFLLQRISARCNAEADQSRIVFEDEGEPSLPTSDLTVELREICLRN